MRKFNVISVDMFGTLADLSNVHHLVWREILGGKYNSSLAEEYTDRASAILSKFFEDKIFKEGRYIPPKVVFEECYSVFFNEAGIDFDPQKAAGIHARHHTQCKIFDDVEPFLRSVGEEYRICLSSDTDEDMLGPLRTMYPFDNVFTSEDIGAYKTGSGGRFFKAVVDYYGIEPESIIHIGDMISDIAGASEAGLTTCWLNRNGRKWPYEIKPEIEVGSLLEFAEVIENRYCCRFGGHEIEL